MNDRDLHLLMDACRVLKQARFTNDVFKEEAELLGDALSQFLVDYINEPVPSLEELGLPF